MSNDSFIREVNEELRQDRVMAIWTRFGKWLIAAAILVVVLTGAYILWDRHERAVANESGDRYLAALDLADANKKDEAIKALEAITADGYGTYPVLARMRIGTIYQSEGNLPEALKAYDAVAANGSAPQALRDMADIRAAYILVDTGSQADVRKHAERLSDDSDPMRFPAREALGLAAWKAGDVNDAKTFFTELRDDPGTPGGIVARARLMLEVIAAGDGKAAAPGAPAASAAPAAPSTQTAEDAAKPAAPPAAGNAPATAPEPSTAKPAGTPPS